jgi:hypothetical protein
VISHHHVFLDDRTTKNDMFSGPMSVLVGSGPCAFLSIFMQWDYNGVFVRKRNLSSLEKPFVLISIEKPLPDTAVLPPFRNIGVGSLSLLGFPLSLKQQWF